MYDNVVAVNTAICEALDLDPHDIKAITIHVRASRVPTVEVEYSIGYIMKHNLDETIRQFELVEVMQPANGSG